MGDRTEETDGRGNVTSVSYSAEKGADDTGALGVAERMKKTNLAAASKKAGGSDIPKPGPGEDMMDPAYRDRLAAWRRSRGTAVTEMIKKP